MEKTQLERLLGFVLIVVAALLFVVFGLVKGSPVDVGVYAITIVPLVLGLGLLWRASAPEAS